VFFLVTYASLLTIGTATRTAWSFAIAGMGCAIVAIAGYPYLNACVGLMLLYGLVESLRNARAAPESWPRAVRQLEVAELGKFRGPIVGHGQVLVAARAGEHQIIRGIHIDACTIAVYHQPYTVLVRSNALPVDLATTHVGSH